MSVVLVVFTENTKIYPKGSVSERKCVTIVTTHYHCRIISLYYEQMWKCITLVEQQHHYYKTSNHYHHTHVVKLQSYRYTQRKDVGVKLNVIETAFK